MTGSSTRVALAEKFRTFACKASIRLGSHWAFLIAVVIVTIWLVSGPFFHFSNAWQLVINTGTTIVTFLMVFLIQATQNRDATAVHLKLDELIRSSKARNIFADLENATEEEITAFQNEFRKLRRSGVEVVGAAPALPKAAGKAR
ncbi:MAG TPA: low affinity iron permease family protein [Polyangia bacterium]|nr:low affinity iron permease family protein [Polyangia bacterium]